MFDFTRPANMGILALALIFISGMAIDCVREENPLIACDNACDHRGVDEVITSVDGLVTCNCNATE